METHDLPQKYRIRLFHPMYFLGAELNLSIFLSANRISMNLSWNSWDQNKGFNYGSNSYFMEWMENGKCRFRHRKISTTHERRHCIRTVKAVTALMKTTIIGVKKKNLFFFSSLIRFLACTPTRKVKINIARIHRGTWL